MIEAPAREITEQITPLKPSEALRLGRLIAPREIKGKYLDGEGGACAAGAIRLGYGNFVGPHSWALQRTPCPSMPCRSYVELLPMIGMVIAHLNDTHNWKTAQIAEWLEGLGL